jgi:hypothetical protein
MPAAALTEALDLAARDAQREHGVQLAYIFDIPGELGAPGASATLEHALRWRPRNCGPGRFGTTLTNEYRRAAEVFGLGREQLAGLGRERRAGFVPRRRG